MQTTSTYEIVRPAAAAWRRGGAVLLLAIATSAAAADWLFYHHPVGWTVGLFAAVLFALLALRGVRFLRSVPGVLIAVATLGLIASLIEQPTPLPVLLTMAGLATLAVLNHSQWQPGAAHWAGRLIELGVTGPFRPLLDTRLVARWRGRHPTRGSRLPLRGILLWILPVVLSAAFVGLFALANPIVEQWTQRLTSTLADFFARWENLPNPARIILWLFAGGASYVLLRARVRRKRRAVPPAIIQSLVTPAELPAERLGRAIVVRCLLAFNVVFAAQNGMDVLYLFGGATLPEGMTYAQYAHRGAYPLVATALLAALFVLVAFRPGGGVAARSPLARRLVYLWLAQNVLLTVSAAWRLHLYVDVYSLTRLRLAAAVWMFLVAAGLLWIVLRIALHKDNRWLLDRNALTALVVLYALCFLNMSALIANFNARHCAEAGGGGPPIDLRYLRSLGPDALPAVHRLTPTLTDPAKRLQTSRIAAALGGELKADLQDWRGWTFRRSRIAKHVGGVDQFELPPPARGGSWRRGDDDEYGWRDTRWHAEDD